MYEWSKSNGNIVVMTKNTCYFRLDQVWNIQVETSENSISRFLDFNIFWGSNLPQETPGGSPLWRSQYFPLLRNIRIGTTPSQTPAKRLALKEIGKIYTVQGRIFFLSFPAPYTCVFFCVLLLCGFSRLLKRENFLAGYIQYKLRSQNRNFSKWNKSTGN